MIFLYPLHFHSSIFFFSTDTATTEIYTLSLHDALPISSLRGPPGERRCASLPGGRCGVAARRAGRGSAGVRRQDRKSTRLNSSHQIISYAVFCLKKKNNKQHHHLISEPLHINILYTLQL